MDKYPEIFDKSLYGEDSLKLNKDFTFNSNGIPCNGDKFIPWTMVGLMDLRGIRSCQSKTGRKITGFQLWELLLRDVGFRERKRIPDVHLVS